MSKKEIRKAAKGCGFKKIIKQLERYIKIINNFRKGTINRDHVVEDDATELLRQVELNKLDKAFMAAIQAFRNNYATESVPVAKVSKQKKVA